MFPKNNLPQQLTSFIGREREIIEVERQLFDARMLTLTGMGGSGKTRLSLKVAAEVLEQYPDGVWFVELATLTNPALAPQAVASVLGVREVQGRSLTPTLAEYLKPQKLLLVLDNCEHLSSACASLASSLLRACSQLTILATSREALNIEGEVSWHVPPLSLPDPREHLQVESLKQYEAIQLFVERAMRIRDNFALTADNGQVLAELCRQLDGLPLAIELAAARVRALSVKQILDLLGQRFKLLTYNTQDSEPRQQTLRALIDWSYDLLTEGEKALLKGLSVFVGSFTLEAVTAVYGESKDEFEVLDLLTPLAEKSLIVVEEHKGEARYRLLETIRQYALERLWEPEAGDQGSGIRDQAGFTDPPPLTPDPRPLIPHYALYRGKHRDWYLAFAELAQKALSGEESKPWLDRLEIEHDNIRAALEWSITGDKNAEAALRLAGAMWRLWDTRGYIAEGRKWITDALNVAGSSPTLARARALNAAANLALEQGDYSRAEELYQGALILRRQMGDLLGSANSLSNMGAAARRKGEYERAAELLEKSLAIHRELDNKDGIAAGLSNLGCVEQCLGNYMRAIELHTEAQAIFRDLGGLQGVVTSLNNLGEAAGALGNYEQARVYFEDALAKAKELEDDLSIAGVIANLGSLANQQRNYKLAADLYRDSLTLYHEQGDKQGIAECLEGLARATAHGHQERAMKLFGAAEAMRERIGYPIPPSERSTHERNVAKARAGLSDELFAEAWAAGRLTSLDKVIELATEWLILPSYNSDMSNKEVAQTRFGLTRRELDVLREITSGLTDAETAKKLALSTRTVQAHLQSIYNKLHVNNRLAASQFAIEHELI